MRRPPSGGGPQAQARARCLVGARVRTHFARGVRGEGTAPGQGQDPGRLLVPTDGIAKARQGVRGDGPAGGRARREVLRRDRGNGHRGRRTAGSGPSRRTGAHRGGAGRICAGMWGPRIGRMVGMTVPLMPMQHQFAWTTPLAELAGETREVMQPMLRHQDFSMYMRQREDYFGIGAYRHRPMPISADDIGRDYRGEGEFPSVLRVHAGGLRADLAGGAEDDSRAGERRDGPSDERAVLLHAGWRAVARRVDGGEGVLDRGGGLDHPRHRRGQGDGRVDHRRRPEHRPCRRRRPPLRAIRKEPGLHPGPLLAVLPRGLRHHPSPAADGGAAPAARPARSIRARRSWARTSWRPRGWERPQWFEANRRCSTARTMFRTW